MRSKNLGSTDIGLKPGKKGRALILLSLLPLTLLVLTLDARISLGVAVGALYVPGVLLTVFGGRKALSLGYAALASVLTLGGLFLKPPVDYMWKVIFNRSISLFCIWSTAALATLVLALNRRREAEAAAKEEAWKQLRVLGGMIPICASCKKIRDDEGSWKQLEEYISKNSEAEFSHGICPDCMRKLYPDYAEEEEIGPKGASDA